MKSSKVTHFEIPVDDMEKAKAFYREVFGWNVQVEPRMQYTMATTSETDKMNIPLERGAINGGIIKREGKLKHPLVTLQVDDVDESLAQVKKHGGKIHYEQDTDASDRLVRVFRGPRWQCVRCLATS